MPLCPACSYLRPCTTGLRGRLVVLFFAQGNYGKDLVAHCCCICCSIVQETNEVWHGKKNRFTPQGTPLVRRLSGDVVSDTTYRQRVCATTSPIAVMLCTRRVEAACVRGAAVA